MNYKEQSLSAGAWQRAFQVIVDNPLDGLPRASFLEERVLTLDSGERIQTPVQGVGRDFSPFGVIPLLNPLDGQPLGESATHQQLQIILYSLYMQLAAERDAKQG